MYNDNRKKVMYDITGMHDFGIIHRKGDSHVHFKRCCQKSGRIYCNRILLPEQYEDSKSLHPGQDYAGN